MLKQRVIAVAILVAAVSLPASAEYVNYTYDARGRIIRIAYENGTVITYTHDAADNFLITTVTCNGSPC